MKTLIAAIISLSLVGGVSAASQAPKVDCTQKKNASKIECKEPPKSDVKPEIKKPEKVDRKAPAATQKKAAEENAKK